MKAKIPSKFLLLVLILLNIYAITFISSTLFINNNDLDNSENENVKTASIPTTEYEWMDNWGYMGAERGKAMTIDSMDNIIIVGDRKSGEQSCSFMLKYDKFGDIIWNITWGIWNGSWVSTNPNDVITDSSNNIYIVGEAFTREGLDGSWNIYIRKYNSSGYLKWHTEWEEYVLGHRYYLALDSLEYLYLAGTIDDYLYETAIIGKYDPLTGVRIWNEIVSFSGDSIVNGFVIDSNDDMYIALRNLDIFNHLIKYRDNGTNRVQLWDLPVNPVPYDLITDMRISTLNNIYLIFRNLTSDLITLVKYDNLGSLQWNSSWYDLGMIGGYYITISSSNYVYASGNLYNIMKFDNLGTNLWNLTPPGLFIEERAYEIALDSTGDIYYAGYCHVGVFYHHSNVDCFIVKYADVPPKLVNPKFEEKKVYGLVIGISGYPGTENDLFFCATDAFFIRSYLKKTCNVAEENIIFLLNSQATESVINSAIDEIRTKIKPGDDLFFYYSGHGVEGGFCPYDTLFYSYSDLDAKFDLINCSNKILILDACHSGSIINYFSSDNLYILTACQSDELAIETSTFVNGVFTQYFQDSCALANDVNYDDIISLEEQYPTILSKVSSYSSEYGIDQHPVEFDNIPGPTTIIPSLCDIAFTRNQKRVSFSFDLKGSGHIYACNLTLSDNINEVTYDITNSTTSNNGFGEYQGEVLWERNPKEISCQLKILIKGGHIRTLMITMNLQSSSNTVSIGNLFLLFMAIALVSITILKQRQIYKLKN